MWSEPLENAVFGLFTADCVKFSRDTAIMTAASDENGCFEFTDVPFGQYIVREIESPRGYILSDKEYAVSIAEDGEVIEITAENKPITVEISKRDVYGNELVGAEMVLENADGETVDKWTSDGTNHIVSKLGAGEYMLKEIAAPDGYVIATDIKFTVDVYGNVMVENADAAVIAEDGTPIVIMVDEAKPSLPDTPHTVTTDNPHTGVSPDNGICIYLMIGSVMLLSLIFASRKNNERNDV